MDPVFSLQFCPARIFDIKPHTLIVDASIIEMVQTTGVRLHLKEIKSVAIKINKIITELGFAGSPESIVLCCDLPLPNPNNHLAYHISTETLEVDKCKISDLINISSDEIKKLIVRSREDLSDLTKKDREEHMRDRMVPYIGMTIAHELTHAIGINLINKKTENFEIKELELLTDSIALLSSFDIFGKHSVLGAYYIYNSYDPSAEPDELLKYKYAISFAKTIISKYSSPPEI